MDYDGDGIEDLISGSYDPGAVYWFPGLGDGNYDRRKTLTDQNGIPLVHHPVEYARYLKQVAAAQGSESGASVDDLVASFGSWAAMVDWDDDGDLDMLIGSFGGQLFLRHNVGTRTRPIYAAQSIAVQADGRDLKGHSHANPVVADWDGDRLWDLVVGWGDGSVTWYRNLGTPKRPRFGPPVDLVGAASDTIFMIQYLSEGQLPIPATRAQICVTDFNDDGRLDLVVGDYTDVYRLPPLQGAAADRMQQLIARQQKLMVKVGDQQQRYKMFEAIEAEIQKIAGPSQSRSHVWLYLRKSHQ